MQLLFLNKWFSDEMLKALCWTFVHSLWQGLLIAALAGIIIASTRKSSAKLRYNLLGVLLVLFLTISGYTLVQQVGNIHVDGPEVNRLFDGDNTAVGNITAEPVNITMTSGESIDMLIGFLNSNASLLMLLWSIFFLVHCIKIFTGLAGIHRLCSYKTHTAHGWQTKLNQLSKAIAISQPVRLLQSELVKVPVAIGFFKPVILVPLGLLSHLPPEQVETILLHELAHIRRRDYLMNILQRFAEAVFFFNPALLWISSLIRQEREACCDDIVVANTRHKDSYLEALVSFQEYSLAHTGYAMAIGSKRHYLLNRVKRMLTRENKKLNLMEKIVLSAGLSILAAFSFIPDKQANAQQTPNQATPKTEMAVPAAPAAPAMPITASVAVIRKESVAPIRELPVSRNKPKPEPTAVSVVETSTETPVAVIPIDTVPPKKEKAKADDFSLQSISSELNDDGKTKTYTVKVIDQQGKTYSYKKVNDKITNLMIDGKRVPENEIGNYSSYLEKIDRAIEKRNAERIKEKEKRRVDAERRKEDTKARVQSTKLRIAEQRTKTERDAKEREKRKEKMKEEMGKMTEERKKENEERRKQMDEQRKQKEKEKEKIKIPKDKNGKIKTFLNGREVVRNNDNKAAININVQHQVQSTNEISANTNTVQNLVINKSSENINANSNNVSKNKVQSSNNAKNISLNKNVNINLNAEQNIRFKQELETEFEYDFKIEVPVKAAPPCKEKKTQAPKEPVTKGGLKPSAPEPKKPAKLFTTKRRVET